MKKIIVAGLVLAFAFVGIAMVEAKGKPNKGGSTERPPIAQPIF